MRRFRSGPGKLFAPLDGDVNHLVACSFRSVAVARVDRWTQTTRLCNLPTGPALAHSPKSSASRPSRASSSLMKSIALATRWRMCPKQRIRLLDGFPHRNFRPRSSTARSLFDALSRMKHPTLLCDTSSKSSNTSATVAEMFSPVCAADRLGRPRTIFRGVNVRSSRKNAFMEKNECLFRDVQPSNAMWT